MSHAININSKSPRTSAGAVAQNPAKVHTAPMDMFVQMRSKIFFGAALKDIKALQASIAQRGLLSPLVVVERGGKLHVIDGQKRLSAMRRLRFAGQLPRNLHRVPFIYYADAQERQSPAPALMTHRELYDGVVQAFKRGTSLDAIASELYLTRQNVMEVLTLARLAPRLRAYFFDGHLTLEQAKAFAAMPCHARQNDVFEEVGPFARAKDILKASQNSRPAKAPIKVVPFRLAA